MLDCLALWEDPPLVNAPVTSVISGQGGRSPRNAPRTAAIRRCWPFLEGQRRVEPSLSGQGWVFCGNMKARAVIRRQPRRFGNDRAAGIREQAGSWGGARALCQSPATLRCFGAVWFGLHHLASCELRGEVSTEVIARASGCVASRHIHPEAASMVPNKGLSKTL